MIIILSVIPNSPTSEIGKFGIGKSDSKAYNGDMYVYRKFKGKIPNNMCSILFLKLYLVIDCVDKVKRK